MQLDEAIQILELSDVRYSDITISLVKKQYHKLALQHHPDKNNNSETSTLLFKHIKEAYDVVNDSLVIISDTDTNKNENNENNNNHNDTENDNTNSSHFGFPPKMEYMYFLQTFIENMVDGKYNVFVASIIKEIVNGYKEVTAKLFEDISKEHMMSIYNFITKYRKVLHLKEETIEKIRTIIIERFHNIDLYVLNPSINDLLEHNIYKLEVNEQIYYCPLWHSEVYFDDIEDGQMDLIVRCEADLLENVVIDDNNNLFITEKVVFSSMLELLYVDISIGKHTFSIPTHELTIQREQYYTFKGCGISRINETDMYNIDKKGDIIVKVVFI